MRGRIEVKVWMPKRLVKRALKAFSEDGDYFNSLLPLLLTRYIDARDRRLRVLEETANPPRNAEGYVLLPKSRRRRAR